MPKNRYYHYDHETCSFVEVKPGRTKAYAQFSAMAVGALLLSGLAVFGIDRLTQTPEELALQAENEALQHQLEATEQRISTFSAELEKLSDADQKIYRMLLQADPISEDLRQVGIGGADPYERFSRFSAPTSQLLKETSQKLDQLERQLGLQNTSFRELSQLAAERALWAAEMPAILPANGHVVSGYGMRRHPILQITRMHNGVDILAGTGSPVFVTGDGVVHEVKRNAGYGLHVVVHHPEAGYETLYAHLSRVPAHIRPGVKVKRGEQIALSGNTGLSKAPHLHYEVHDLDGRALNPVHFFAPSMTPQQYKALLTASETYSISLD